MTGAQNADDFIHVVVVGTENRNPAQLLGNLPGRARVETFGGHHHDEDVVLLPESSYCVGDGG